MIHQESNPNPIPHSKIGATKEDPIDIPETPRLPTREGPKEGGGREERVGSKPQHSKATTPGATGSTTGKYSAPTPVPAAKHIVGISSSKKESGPSSDPSAPSPKTSHFASPLPKSPLSLGVRGSPVVPLRDKPPRTPGREDKENSDPMKAMMGLLRSISEKIDQIPPSPYMPWIPSRPIHTIGNNSNSAGTDIIEALLSC